MNYAITTGDCLTHLKILGDETVKTCITSPPYYGLRNYGADGQIGVEATIEDYVQKLVDVFTEVRRVLKPDGTLWLNLGDSYAGSWSGNSPRPEGGSQRSGQPGRQSKLNDRYPARGGYVPTGLKNKDLIGVPWRVAFALQASGWYLRQDIIWHKTNPMPESVRDRCTKAHEYIFLMSKSERYYFDHEAFKEPSLTAKEAKWDNGENGHASAAGSTGSTRKFSSDPTKRNRRSVWSVTSKPFKEAHFATFPTALIEPCVLAGSGVGDIVLDPFTGAGTTGLVAVSHQRQFMGFEINPEFTAMAERRIASLGELI